MLLTDTRNREEVSILEFFISFLIAVLGGVACHYKSKEESLNCTGIRLRDSFLCQYWLTFYIFLPTGIIAYAKNFFNMLDIKNYPYLASLKTYIA